MSIIHSRLTRMGGLLALLTGLVWTAYAQTGAFAPQWHTPLPGNALSSYAPEGVDHPVIESAGTQTLVSAFNWHRSSSPVGLPDPFYTLSTNNGGSWTTPAPIFESAGIESLQLDFALSGSDSAHAVWIEDIDLLYANGTIAGNQINWSAPTPLAEPPFDPGSSDPVLLATATGIVDVVWAEANPYEPDIMHRRKTPNGGWSATEIVAETPLRGTAPEITRDHAGNLHLVWEENGADILYSAGTTLPNGTTQWASAVSLATAPAVLHLGKQPTITSLNSGTLIVAFVKYLSRDQQWIYTTTCSDNCTVEANWSEPELAYPNWLGANSNAPLISPQLISTGSCAYLFFNGTTTTRQPQLAGDEQLFTANSCDGWQASANSITASGSRSLHPNATLQGRSIHLSYTVLTNNQGFGYHLHGELPTSAFPAVYLPMVVR